jgi:hypothetical protein
MMRPPDTVYCVDSSTLMNFERWLPVDIFPGLWDDLGGMIKKGRLFSHREVYDEIQVGSGYLVDWSQNYRTMFIEHTPEQGALVRKILKAFPELSGANKTSSQHADAWLVATALLATPMWTVVADESARPEKRKIPAACKHFGVPAMSGAEFLRAEGWRYVRLR